MLWRISTARSLRFRNRSTSSGVVAGCSSASAGAVLCTPRTPSLPLGRVGAAPGRSGWRRPANRAHPVLAHCSQQRVRGDLACGASSPLSRLAHRLPARGGDVAGFGCEREGQRRRAAGRRAATRHAPSVPRYTSGSSALARKRRSRSRRQRSGTRPACPSCLRAPRPCLPRPRPPRPRAAQRAAAGRRRRGERPRLQTQISAESPLVSLFPRAFGPIELPAVPREARSVSAARDSFRLGAEPPSKDSP